MAYSFDQAFAADVVRPPRVASVFAVTALGVNALLLNGLAVLGTAHLVRDGGAASEDVIAVVEVVQWPALLAASIAVIVWLWQARANADAIDGLPETWGRPWVIFGWIVPVISFFVPRNIVGGVWRASAPPGRSAWPVNAWWAAWLGYLLGTRILGLSDDGGGVGGGLYPAVAELGAVAALLAMFLVWRITAFQEAQAVRLREAIAAEPAPIGGTPA